MVLGVDPLTDEYSDLMPGTMLQRLCEEGIAGPVFSVITTENVDAHITRSCTDMLYFKEQYCPVAARLG